MIIEGDTRSLDNGSDEAQPKDTTKWCSCRSRCGYVVYRRATAQSSVISCHHVYYSLNSLKGVDIGDYIGDYYRGY